MSVGRVMHRREGWTEFFSRALRAVIDALVRMKGDGVRGASASGEQKRAAIAGWNLDS